MTMHAQNASRCRASFVLLALTLTGCSGSSGGGSSSSPPTTPEALGAIYKFADSDVSGWSQSTDPNDPWHYNVFSDQTLDQRIDGGNLLYLSHGMTLAMYQDLVGPNKATCTIIAMYFGTDTNATSMFNDQKTTSGGTTTIGSYDTGAVIGESLPTGITVFAHFKAFYFEVQVDGISDQTAAAQAANQFVKVLETKTK